MPARDANGEGALAGKVVLRIATSISSRGHHPVPLFREFGLSLEALADRGCGVSWRGRSSGVGDGGDDADAVESCRRISRRERQARHT